MAKKKNSVEQELQKEHFRVAIFGSARIQKDDEIYKMVFRLAKSIGKEKFDIVTGGGPGLMEAANAGHEAGDTKHDSDSIGLLIKLPWEAKGNGHLEIKKKFNKFSTRLDHFMALSRAIVVVPGGIGTALELFYTWQLIQVKHIPAMPIILVGKMWEELIKWVKKYPVKNGLISPENLNVIHIAKDEKEAMKMIKKANKCYLKEGKHYFDNIGKYKIS
ncbi:LOG family protein [Candidatus Gracilibacteria bacterium]|nr:LOG family protein [Candidatus Gracilibacteria bacterium]